MWSPTYISKSLTIGADGEAAMTKKRVEAVDPEKNLIKFRVIEGDMMKDFKSFVSTIQVIPKHGEPGSVVKWHMEYEKIIVDAGHPQGRPWAKPNETFALAGPGHPETILQLAVEISKDIDEYLLAEE
ncbi:hypothetical protein Bca4012_101577 [Brassica carinata]